MSTGAVLAKLAKNVSAGVNDGSISLQNGILIFVIIGILFALYFVFVIYRDKIFRLVIDKIRHKSKVNVESINSQEKETLTQIESSKKSEIPQYCIKCGAKLPDDSEYCMKCGERITHHK